MSDKLANFREARSKAEAIGLAFKADFDALISKYGKTGSEAQAQVLIQALNLTVIDLLQEVMKTNLSIAEKISLAGCLNKKVYDVLPRQRVIDLVKEATTSVVELVKEVLDVAQYTARADTIRHDLEGDKRVTPIKVGDTDAYAVDFDSPKELIDFMMETFGLTEEQAQAYVRTG